MTSRLTLPLCLLALLVLAVPATAEAKYSVGIGEQNATVFDNSAWQSAKLKRIRYMVPWDYAKTVWQADEVHAWMQRDCFGKGDAALG